MIIKYLCNITLIITILNYVTIVIINPVATKITPGFTGLKKLYLI